ncbi:glycoside hydrolase family 26 protein [Halomarina oriensis]|uniref:Beta-mannanase n=1 Tax=Halomarina oriensis TaxID=671145 RepID=A0A6B0GNX3_9EURY|nr:glycosyl hydrolase [Halomarina oriensis]MWG35661.1 beta-mannanase [Halomarina oriensis]
MNRRTFLGLSGGTLGVALGGTELYRLLTSEDDAVRERRQVPTTTPTPTEEPSPTAETPPEATPQSVETRTGRLLLGVTPETRTGKRLTALERWQGKDNAVVGLFLDVGRSDGELLALGESVLTPIWDHGSVPHVIWQPFVAGQEDTPATVPQDIAAGRHDRLFERWASVFGRWCRPESGPERRLYLNFAPEMNGDWVPWDTSAGGTTAADYVAMYRRVHDIVMARGLTDEHVQWVWAVNHVGRSAEPLAAFYPGDDYVDWCGVHGYNFPKWGGWAPPEQIYGPTLDAVRAITDNPVVVSEYGSSSVLDGTADPTRKGRWIRDVFAYFEASDVRMALWFNHEKETDWAVFGGSRGTETVRDGTTTYHAYREYREAVASEDVLGSYSDHPRRLTTEEFHGDLGE